MSGLDAEVKGKIGTILKKLRCRGKTVIVAEHNLEAIDFADRLLVLDRGILVKDSLMKEALADCSFLTAYRLKFTD
ncbi:MAG: ABC transporter ATP-binding protein, partial [Dehalobacterium sp.]